MKVLRINTAIDQGGAAHSAVNINQAVKELGVESWMLTARGYNDISNQIMSLNESKLRRYCNILTYRILGKEGFFNQKLWRRTLKDLDSFDLVHIHNTHGYYLPFNVLEKLLLKPCVWTLHDYWVVTGGPGFFVQQKNKSILEKIFFFSNLRYPKEWIDRKRKRRKKISELIKKYNPAFVAITNDMAVRLRDNGLKSDNVNIIPHGLFESDTPPDPSIRNEIKNQLGWPTNKKVLLFISSQVDNPIKGFDVFINALTKINSNNWIAYVVGGNYKNSAHVANKKGLKIRFVGKVEEGKMEKYYQGCDIYVASTFDETYGRTVVEALANGCQVICSDIPVLREVTNNKALFFEVGSSDKLADIINHTIENPQSEKKLFDLALNARKRFSKNRMGKNYLKLYKQIAG